MAGHEGPLHGPGLHLILPAAGVDGREQAGADAEGLGRPLPVPPAPDVGGGDEQRLVLAVLEALVGVVEDRVTGPGPGRIVRGRALRNQRQPAPARLVVAEQLLQGRGAVLLAGRHLYPEDEQPVESGAGLLGGERNGQRHARGERSVEVSHPPQLVRHVQVAAVGVDDGVRVGRRVGARVGSHVQGQGDQAADGLEHRLPPDVADDDETLGELAELRCLRPGRRLGRRVRGEDHERGGDGDVPLGRRRRRGVGQVDGGVTGDQLGRPGRADRGVKCVGRRLQRGRVSRAGPRRRPVGGDRGRLGRAQRVLGRDDEDLVRGGRLDGPVSHVDRLVGVGDVPGPAGTVRRDEIAPGRPFISLDPASPPEVLPVALGVRQLGGRERGLEGIDGAVVRVDADQQAGRRRAGRAVLGDEPGLQADREQRERRAVRKPA